jgi:uncharacterized protein
MATALVTGGTSGIGATFAEALARTGYDLVLIARDENRLKEVAAELRSAHGCQVEVISADLNDRADVQVALERITDTDRPIELLVNNAGFGVHMPLSSDDTAVHERAINVMIRAVLLLGGAAARTMRARGHGTIINVSSVAGFITMGSYSAVKAWVTSYTEGLAVELRGTGVNVTALCPGWVRTEFHERAGINSASIPKSLWVDGDHVVESCLRDARRGKVISIPSLRFKVASWFVRYLPRRAVRAISGAISSRRNSANLADGSDETQADRIDQHR